VPGSSTGGTGGTAAAAAAAAKTFRDYDKAATTVSDSYLEQRVSQTYEFARRATDKYCDFAGNDTFWDLFDKLVGFVDLSDPDTELSNHQHLFQTAEGLRRDGHPDWMQFVGLAHDLGKILHLKGGTDEEGTSMATQWGIVGDTYITGCRIPDTVVYPQYNGLNADMADERYNTTQGIYDAGTGLSKATPTFGHDEYIYQLFKHNGVAIPEAGMYMLRFHSLYTWHTEGEYTWLMDDKDREMLPWVQLFNKYDLYTKDRPKLDEAEMRLTFGDIVDKFAPHGLAW